MRRPTPPLRRRQSDGQEPRRVIIPGPVAAFGAFVLGVVAIITFVIGVFASNQHFVLAGLILVLAFFVVAFHVGENDFRHRR